MSRERPQRAAGTRTPMDVARALFRPPTGAAEDAEALTRGESRTVACFFRGLSGQYPRRFTNVGWLDLTPEGLTWRPSWVQFWHQQWHITGPAKAAYVRARDPAVDRLFKGSGTFAPDGAFAWRGFSVIVCETPDAVLEFAVPNPDTALMLSYLQGSTH